MGAPDAMFVGSVDFLRSFIGIIRRPYETYRALSLRRNWWEIAHIALLLVFYFATASLVKTAAFRPYILTRQFLALASTAGATAILVSATLWIVGIRFFGGRGEYLAFARGWAYTLIPTVLWFWTTSILFVAIPPPRTASIQGLAFSILYLTFSAVLFYWKVMLSYLALRFGMKMDLRQIIQTVIVSSPVIALYGVVMYRFGVFKVPFI